MFKMKRRMTTLLILQDLQLTVSVRDRNINGYSKMSCCHSFTPVSAIMATAATIY